MNGSLKNSNTQIDHTSSLVRTFGKLTSDVYFLSIVAMKTDDTLYALETNESIHYDITRNHA